MVLDMTDIAVDPKKKPAGAWGWCSKGKFFGFKLSLLCFPQGIPVAFAITRANQRETAVVIPLLKDARNILGNAKLVEYVIGDAAYDSEKFAKAVKEILGAQAVFPYNRRRSAMSAEDIMRLSPEQLEALIPQKERAKALGARYSPGGNEIYSQRVFSEHVNSHLKEQFNIDQIPHHIKGMRKIKRFIEERIFTYVCCGYPNIKNGLNFRSFAFI